MDTLNRIRNEEKLKAQAKLPGCLQETMTVNRVIHDFPKTRDALKELLVNIPIEGCHCLDEVAWRHGMKTQDLVSTLEKAIAPCACKQVPEKVTAEHLEEV